jgi:hypothetical protein
MRIPIAILAAAMTLAACASRREATRSLEPQTYASVRLYSNALPQCPYHELGYVTGRRSADIRRAAFNMRANGVILEPVLEANGSVAPFAGTAIRFDSANCRG